MSEGNEYDTTYGLTDDELTERFRAGVRLAQERRSAMGLPTVHYDEEKKVTYYEYPDGRKEYVRK